MPIPQNIEKEHILSAINRIDNNGYSSARESDKYDLYYHDKTYPPKVVISYANIYANGAEWPGTEFSGGNESNDFLINRGFPILQKDTLNPDDFFTVEELHFFNQYSGQPYNSEDEVHKNAAEYISRVIWEHSKKWANHIIQHHPFRLSGRKTWNEMVNNEFGQRFRPYSWYRLSHKDYDSNNVFYTVGVEGPHEGQLSRVVIKLDCYRAKLSYDAQDRFDNLLEEKGIDWKIITSAELSSMGWQDLLDTSTEYINSTLDVFIEAIALVDNNIETKYARIAWNSNDWVQPSGRPGKSKYESHEKDYGYGHEEWLFDLNKTIDDYHYSRLEPLNTKSGKHVGKTYNIKLYTYNEEEKQWYSVGYISNVEVLSAEESAEIAAIYRNNGWLSQQVAELKNEENVDSDNFNRWSDGDRFNIRFKPEDVNFHLQKFLDGKRPVSSHYNLLDTLEYQTEDEHLDQGDDISFGITVKGRKGRKSKSTINKTHQPKLSEIENIHGKLQDAFLEYLENEGKEVYVEGVRNFDNKRIDIVEVCKTNTGQEKYTFYEIKSYPSVSHSIRVALGQLLEYAYYPEENLTNEFVIVSHLKATDSDNKYLAHISRLFNISLKYICFDYKTNAIVI